MLVHVVSRRHENGRKTRVDETVKQEPVTGLQPETVGAHAPMRLGPISALAAALHLLVHPRAREKLAEASTETEQTRNAERDRGAYRSPMEAGITGGFTLLMDDPHARKRR
jgi:hypothetical protein